MVATYPTKHEQNLRAIFRTMDAANAQEIREAYYKAVEGLQTLATALEVADRSQPEDEYTLIDEHFIACKAIDEMKKSLLGRIL